MLLVALVVLLRRKADWGTGWVWPVPSVIIGGRRYDAVISQESHTGHNGVDIMYARPAFGTPARMAIDAAYKRGTPDGSPGHFAPNATPIVAAKAGTVWSVDKSPRGWQVVIDHGKPFATYYQHLESTVLGPHKNGVNTATGQPTRVTAGWPIGIMGGDPTEPTHLRHLHFEVWEGGAADHAISPDDEMATWPRPSLVFTP